jgi:hypothetical protein
VLWAGAAPAAFMRCFGSCPREVNVLAADVLHLDAAHQRVRREDRRAVDVLESSGDRLTTLACVVAIGYSRGKRASSISRASCRVLLDPDGRSEAEEIV